MATKKQKDTPQTDLEKAVEPLRKEIRRLQRHVGRLEKRLKELEDSQGGLAFRLEVVEGEQEDQHFMVFARAFEEWRASPAGQAARQELSRQGIIGARLDEAVFEHFQEQWNAPEATPDEHQHAAEILTQLLLDRPEPSPDPNWARSQLTPEPDDQ